MFADKKTLIIVVAAVVVLVLIIGISLFVKSSPGGGLNVGGPGGGTPAAPTGPVTRAAAPANVAVPGVGDVNAPKDVAVPTDVLAASPNRPAGESIRVFNVQANTNQFTPDTYIAKKGDTVKFNITAVDKDYDFLQPDIGSGTTIKKGTTKVLQFDVTAAGKFTIYCQSCGGPAKGPLAYLIVANQ